MRQTLEDLMYQEGIDVFGTSDVSSYVPEVFSKTPYAVTIGAVLSRAVIKAVKKGPTKNYFHHYRTANAFLDMCAFKCVVYLQRNGYEAVAIPASQTTNSAGIAADFSHKIAANLAGLGFVGKSGLFITDKFGPGVRFATVLTNLKLEGNAIGEPKCGDCNLCVAACPCGAIVGNMWKKGIARDDIVDASLCNRFMKDKFKMIGRGSVCGICIAVCPYCNNTNI